MTKRIGNVSNGGKATVNAKNITQTGSSGMGGSTSQSLKIGNAQ